jgi:hypothetical protein
MRTYKKELETIADDLLKQNAEAKGNENKPNYSNRDFMNATIIFQTALTFTISPKFAPISSLPSNFK